MREGRRALWLALLASLGCSGRGSEVREGGGPGPGPQGPYAILETDQGAIRVRLSTAASPKAAQRFIHLARERKLYDGTTFFRVVPEFVIQGGASVLPGDLLAPGTVESVNDLSTANPFEKAGVLALAGEGAPDGGQFFITVAPAPWLHRKHLVVGEVVEGLEAAVAISRAARRSDEWDRPLKPASLLRVRIEER